MIQVTLHFSNTPCVRNRACAAPLGDQPKQLQAPTGAASPTTPRPPTNQARSTRTRAGRAACRDLSEISEAALRRSRAPP